MYSYMYFDKDTNSTREDFVWLLPITDMSGKGLAQVLLEIFRNVEVNLNYLIGITLS